jgi:hypothetical protein
MSYKMKPVRCDNCRFFVQHDKYRYDGTCLKDGEYTAEHRVCNKLPTNEDKRNAKINLYH